MNSRIIYSAALLIGLLYLSSGVYPVALFETDAMGVLSGCKRIIETGQFGENEYTYYFHSQPGIYAWIIGFQQLTGTSLPNAYSLLTALFGLFFAGLSAYFVARLLDADFVSSMLCLLLFQEVYSACFYMNSATGAAFFMIAAFCVVYNQNGPFQLIGSGLLLALAAWTRLDVAITFPVVALLFKADTVRSRIQQTALLSVVFVAAFSGLCWVSNARNVLHEVLGGGSSLSFMDNQQTARAFVTSQFVRVLVGYFSVLTVLLMIQGIRLLIRAERWQLLGICLLPVSLFILLIGGRLVAGKHLLYYAPFFAIPVLTACRELYKNGFRQGSLLFKTLLVLAVLQYVVGVQVSFAAYPYSNSPYASIRPYPTFCTLATVPSPTRQIDSIRLVFGGGTKLSTSDEMMLSSGILFAPLMWSHLKQDTKADYAAISEYLASFQGDTLHMTTSQGGAYPIRNFLYLSDYKLIRAQSVAYSAAAVYQWTWRQDNRIVAVDQSLYPKQDYPAYIRKLRAAPYASYLHLAFWDWERWYLHRFSRQTDTVRHVGYFFQTLRSDKILPLQRGRWCDPLTEINPASAPMQYVSANGQPTVHVGMTTSFTRRRSGMK